ncbi:OmpA family protein [Aliidiomarina sp. Khilg15.8]
MQKTILSSLILSGLLCTQSAAEASVREYGASLDSSEWRVSEYSPVQCTLEHEIPRYGNVRFVSEADRSMNMRLQLDMLRLPDTYDVASIKSVAPQWRPGVASQPLGDMDMYRQFSSELGKQMAWTILTELEKGMHPTFQYQDWHNRRDSINVRVSAVNFHDRYEDFLQCVSNLLPYSFEDISFTVLNYQERTEDLTNPSKRRLLQISEYLRHDNAIELVLVDAHTDSYGPFEENEELSQRRAESVKSFLLEHGVNESQIRISAHGERRQVAGNDSELERATNRRVVVQMKRPFNPALLSSRAD